MSENSANSLQRASMGSGDSATAEGGQESLAARLTRNSGRWSLLPNPARLLDTCRLAAFFHAGCTACCAVTAGPLKETC